MLTQDAYSNSPADNLILKFIDLHLFNPKTIGLSLTRRVNVIAKKQTSVLAYKRIDRKSWQGITIEANLLSIKLR